MKSQPIFACPSAAGLIPADIGIDSGFSLGYGVNQNIMPAQPGGTPATNLSQVAASAETILLADSAGVYDNNGSPALGFAVALNNPSDTNDGPDTFGIHTQKSNVGWVDGHAKSQNISIRPISGYYGSDPVVLAGAQQYTVGDVLNPQYPYGSQWQDYYYSLDKPN
jgi:prepilin-type processing-associated H-X9-DG protein